MPCEHCESLLRDADTEDTRSIAPFFGCVSLPQYYTSYSNCLIVGRNTSCSWCIHGKMLGDLQKRGKTKLGLSSADTKGGLVIKGKELEKIGRDSFAVQASWN